MLSRKNRKMFSNFIESEMVDHLSKVYGTDESSIRKAATFVSKAVDMGYVAILNDMDKKKNRGDFEDILEAIYDDNEEYDSGHEAYHTSKDKMYSRMREQTNTNLYSLHGLQEGSVA